MLLLGILSVVQIALLPGYILLLFLKVKTESTIQKFIYIFALSLFVNYSLVAILTLLKLYTNTTLWLVIILELICLLILLKARKIKLISDFKFSVAVQEYLSVFKNFSLRLKIVAGLASTIILFYFALFIANFGTIFYFVDTVNLIHWNTWAKDFANNILPYKSSHFPQLIPANWSISYVLIGNSDINFFPKSFMPLFFFGNLLMFLDLAIWKKNYTYLIGLIIYGLFAPIIYSLVFIADGNADLPVSFFAFLTFYTYLKLSKNKFETTDRILFFLFAATTAATKLAGFYIFLFASIISLYGFIKYWREIKKSHKVLIALLVPLIVGICFFWHFIKPDVMVSGLHQPEYVGENYIVIFTNAAKMMYYNWGLPVLAFLLLTLVSSLFVKNVRYITLIMVIPPLIIWMLKYSVDFRNLSFVVPFLSYVSAFGLINIIEIVRSKPLNLDFEIIYGGGKSLLLRQKMIGGIICVLCVGLFFLIKSEFTHDLIIQIHKFISMHYFQSHRINLLIDYTQYISIDYYQNVLATLVLIIPVLFLLAVANLRLIQVLIIIGITTVILNFSFLKEDYVVAHQQKLIEQVDARNYAAWMNTLIESLGFDKKVYTNFKSISEEKVPGDLKFIYLNNDALEKQLSNNNVNQPFFLKTDLLGSDLKAKIDMKISNSQTESFFDDGVYSLIIN